MAPVTKTATAMTTRQRISACIRGEEVDRLPVWLKMANATWASSQPAPYRDMPGVELLRAAGCDVMAGVGVNCRREAPRVTCTVDEADGLRRTTCRTPDGVLTGEERLDPATRSWHPIEFMVETAADLAALRWLYEGTSYEVPADSVAAAAERQRELEADDAFTMTCIGPSPVMDLVQHVAGPVNAFYLLADEPELFREITDAMHADRMRCLAARLPHEPADTFWISENTSTTLISPTIFEEFCAVHLADYGRAILEAGIIPVHHMCGTLNALLESIDGLPALANEAYTTRPLGDVSLAEGRRRMPSKCLIGGTNATLWLRPAEEIIRTVAEDLAECPDRRKIFLTSAGVLPPQVSFEKARRVVEGLKALAT